MQDLSLSALRSAQTAGEAAGSRRNQEN